MHAGGVLSDALIPKQSLQTMRPVFAPKIQGTGNILAHCSQQPIQAVKLFSSVASALGSGGQANYAAANAVMDSAALQAQDQVTILTHNHRNDACEYW